MKENADPESPQTRWSSQIYLEMEDYAHGAEALKVMCERAKNGGYLQEQSVS